MSSFVSLDKIDHKILQKLLEDGRASFSSIAKEVKLTDVAIKKRVESLIKKGVISSVTANLNYKVLGYENPVFVQMRTDMGKHKDLVKKLNSFDYVLELYQVLGEYNLIAKIIVPNIDSAERFINDLGLIDGISEIKTLLVLSELKKTNVLPAQSLQKKL